MDFLGRKKELRLLEQQWARSESFVVVYGRRRVGKTRLIKQFLEGKESLYFLASKESAPLNRRRFAQLVAEFVGMPALAEGSFEDWRPLFRLFADHRRAERKVLVIDELPYLMEGDAAFASIMQGVWDEILREANVMLILCGSSVHMMEEGVLDHASPLYGRSTAVVRLKPLSFRECQEGLLACAYEDQLALFAITGGVPRYLEFFDGQPIARAVRDDILSPMGFLYNEPRFLLSQDTRNPLTHYSILRALSCGNRKVSEMARLLERPQTDLSPYLKALERLGYIERRVPATEKRPERSKRGLYFIADGFLGFWFTYVLPFEGELEMGNDAPSLRALERTFDTEFVPFAFEAVSRQTLAELCATGRVPFEPQRIGGFWNQKGTVEIDVCAASASDDEILLGECKCHREKPFSMAEFVELERKAQASGLAERKRVLYCLFSKTGFDSELMDAARARGDLYLVDRNQLIDL